MSVFLSTNSFEMLQKGQLRQTSQEKYKCAKQQNVTTLQNSLVAELRRQIRLQEQRTREIGTCVFPVVSHKSKREETLRSKMYFKTIQNRIPSATRTPSGHEATMCDRNKKMQDFQTGRHFCELLGPRLCVDCTKTREREEVLQQYQETPTSFFLERDPFSPLVCNHLTNELNDEDSDSDEEIFDSEILDEDELSDVEELTGKRFSHPVSNVAFTPSLPPKGDHSYPSPPTRGDSGYSSRVSHIRKLTRTQSCSILRNLPQSFTPVRREKTHAPIIREKHADSRQSSGFVSPTRVHPMESASKTCPYLDTIQKLQSRKELNRHKIDASKSWHKSPVEPVLMELKLINFTQYDKLGYEPLPMDPEPVPPSYAVDDFGFPLMEMIKVTNS